MRRANGKRGMDNHDLHALLDNELSPADKLALIDRLQHDDYRRNELCELRNLKEMVKTAYDDIALPETKENALTNSTGGWTRLRVAAASIAASLILVFTAVFTGQLGSEPSRLVLLDPEGKGARPALPGDKEMRIVFHVSGHDPDSSEEILREVESMLTSYGAQGKKLRIEIVAHGKGLAMLREKLSTQKQKIAELSKHFPNLTFVACMNTVKRLRVEQGVIVNLIPEAIPIHSGVAHVVKRQQEGWIYIQV